MLAHALGAISFDDAEYKGLVVDKKLSSGDLRFNKWKKTRNTCKADIAIGFRGKDLYNGRAFTKIYCAMGMYLAKTKHTASLTGYCVRERLYEGQLRQEFSPISGMMQKRTNGSW